jgi:hypothetical protein
MSHIRRFQKMAAACFLTLEESGIGCRAVGSRGHVGGSPDRSALVGASASPSRNVSQIVAALVGPVQTLDAGSVTTDFMQQPENNILDPYHI